MADLSVRDARDLEIAARHIMLGMEADKLVRERCERYHVDFDAVLGGSPLETLGLASAKIKDVGSYS